jgi:hypothetical protein
VELPENPVGHNIGILISMPIKFLNRFIFDFRLGKLVQRSRLHSQHKSVAEVMFTSP